MLFPKNDHILKLDSVKTGTEIACFGKLLSDTFWAINSRAQDCRNGVWNDPIGLVKLLVYGTIYTKVEDFQTENKFKVAPNTNQRKWMILYTEITF